MRSSLPCGARPRHAACPTQTTSAGAFSSNGQVEGHQAALWVSGGMFRTDAACCCAGLALHEVPATTLLGHCLLLNLLLLSLPVSVNLWLPSCR